MALFHSPSIVRSNLILHYDAANTKSYSYNENLIAYSSTFATTSGWYIQGAVAITPNAAIAPNGTQTASAYYLNAPAGRGVDYGPLYLTTGATYTFSIYLQATSSTSYTIGHTDFGTSYIGANYGIALTAAQGWVRASYTFQASTNTSYVQFQDYSGNTGTLFYCWGAQLQRSPTLNQYVATSGSTITASTSLVDLSNSRINGTLVKNPSYVSSASGVLNYSSSTNNYVTIPYSTAHEFAGQSPFSLEVWTKPTEDPGVNSYRRIVGHESFGPRDGYTIWVNNPTAGNYSIVQERWVNNNYGGNVGFTVASSAILGKWNHIVTTFDGISMSMYRNGVLTSGPATVSTTGTVAYGVALQLANYVSSAYSYSGDIGIFRVYSKALSATEVQQNFEANRTRYGI